jgi:hypothetical protein
MSPLWVLVVGLIALGAILLAVALRRTHDEMSPAIQAFADFRAALTPAVARLKRETRDARERVGRGSAPRSRD